jgi:NADPH:quinone reductase-like Zn-dependent oxidoreductase
VFSSLPPRDASAPLHEAAGNPLPALFNRLTINSVYVGSRSMFEAMNRANTANRHEPVIDRVFGFGEAIDAYQYLQKEKHFGKVVIRIGDS